MAFSSTLMLTTVLFGCSMAIVMINQSNGNQNCAVVNGIVYENGHSRPLTMYEKAQMDRYYQQLSDYNAETMKNAFPPGFPFHETSFSGRERTVNTRPKLSMPQFPMICGNANNNGHTGSSSYNPSGQHSQIRNGANNNRFTSYSSNDLSEQRYQPRNGYNNNGNFGSNDLSEQRYQNRNGFNGAYNNRNTGYPSNDLSEQRNQYRNGYNNYKSGSFSNDLSEQRYQRRNGY